MFQIIQRLQNVEDQVLDVKNSKFKMTKKMMDSLFSGEDGKLGFQSMNQEELTKLYL